MQSERTIVPERTDASERPLKRDEPAGVLMPGGLVTDEGGDGLAQAAAVNWLGSTSNSLSMSALQAPVPSARTRCSPASAGS